MKSRVSEAYRRSTTQEATSKIDDFPVNSPKTGNFPVERGSLRTASRTNLSDKVTALRLRAPGFTAYSDGECGPSAVALTVQNRSDLFFCRGCFRDQQAERFCGVVQQPVANRPLAIDKPPDGPFVYAKTPRSCGNAAKDLDAMGKVILRRLRCK